MSVLSTLPNLFDSSGSGMPASEAIRHTLTGASLFIPERLQQIVRHTAAYIPAELNLSNSLMFILYFSAASLILGLLSRVVLGKRSSLNMSLSSVMGILFIYAVTICVFTFKPWNLEIFLSPLPFVTFSGDYLIVLPITDLQFPALCTEILSLIILAFLVNLLDTVIPQGERVFTWYILRVLCVLTSMAVHLGVRWALRQYCPNLLLTYAPTVLLILLAIMLFSGVVSLVLGIMIAFTNPFLGAMYSFFFSNIVGKQVSKAVFTAAVLCGIAYLLDYFGYTVICITTAALAAYVPMLLVLFILWYLIGHIL